MCRQNKPNMVHLFKYEFVQVPCMSSIGMGQSDRVKRIGRAGQPRQLSGLAVRTFLLTPLVLHHGCFLLFGGAAASPRRLRHTTCRGERNAHGRVPSPCAFRCASSDEQRGDLGLCQTHDCTGVYVVLLSTGYTCTAPRPVHDLQWAVRSGVYF